MTKRLLNIIQQYNRQARLFLLVIAALGFAIDGVYTVLMNLYLLRLGYGTEFIGLLNAVALITFALTSFPAGVLGSRWSNILMLKVGVGFILLGGGLLPLAEFTPLGWQDSWLIVTYALMLSGFSLFFVNGAPFLMNIVDTDKQNNAFAIQTALLSLAAFVGSLLGGMLPEFIITLLQDLTLADPAPYRMTLMVVTVVISGAFLMILMINEPSEQTPLDNSGGAESIDDTPSAVVQWAMPTVMLIGIMTLIRLFQVAGTATVIVYFNVYMDTQLATSTSVIGAIAAIGRLLGVPTALIVPALIRRWGKGNVVIWGSLATAVCLLPLALVEHWLAAAIGYIGVLAMTSIRFPAFIVYILELVPKVQQSVMVGSGEMAAGFSFSMMALGGGIILSLFTFRDLFLVGAGLTVLGTFVFWLHFRTSKVKQESAYGTT
jgi:MFS family permease